MTSMIQCFTVNTAGENLIIDLHYFSCSPCYMKNVHMRINRIHARSLSN
uniref:Uncharacterized protein n=1 Tax=Anguilla anguilla TaxID=7936 RepID=A0A0E9UNT3_ANGAN